MTERWDIERLTDKCGEIAASQGYRFDTPVKVNGRLTRTLGRVISTGTVNGGFIPLRVEFSKELLETATDESIAGVISHEMAHWLVLTETHEDHGHDDVFKAMCGRIGCNDDKASMKVDHVVDVKETYKYAVYCPNCGVIGRYKIRGKVIKNIDRHYCMKCGNRFLEVREEYYECSE